MKITLLAVLCFLAWFATMRSPVAAPFNPVENALADFSGRLDPAIPAGSGQLSEAVSKLFPDAQGLDLPSIKSVFERLANGNLDGLSGGVSEELKGQLKELGLDEGTQTLRETSEAFQVPLPVTAPDIKLAKLKNIVSKAMDIYTSIKIFFSDNEQTVFKGCVYFDASSAILLLILFLARFWRVIRLLTEAVFKVSGKLLLYSSVMSPVVFYCLGVNPWQYASGALLWLPGALLIICAISYQFLESNYPIWKKLYISFSYPVFSGAAIYLKHFLPF